VSAGTLRQPVVRPRAAGASVVRVGRSLVGRWLVLVILIGIWQVAAVAGGSVFFPPPSDIASRMQELWLSAGPPFFFTDAVAQDVLPSLGRMVAGWGLAVVAGVGFGLVVGTSRAASDAAQPVMNFLRSTPGTALLPIFLIILGTGSTMRISLIAFSSVWPVLLNTVEGVRTVEPVQLETARSFGLNRAAQFRRVVLPAAMPKILAGMRVAVSIALILMVVSELVAATNGIGYQLINAQHLFLMTDMWAGIVLLAALGYLLNVIFETVERRVLRWHRGVRRRDQ
jgi:ABC-type nitrate/sulfonate/bicarbonate transport system permease component